MAPNAGTHARPPAAPGEDGAARIASHYKYALAHALDAAFPGAPGVIVAEDDFLFAFEPEEVVGATFLSGVARRHFLAWHRIGGGEAACEHG